MMVTLCATGCVPMDGHYRRIEAPNAQYFKDSCFGGAGPESLIYYPFHGVYISLNVSSRIRLGLHLPEGATAQMNDNVIVIRGRTESQSIERTFKIEATWHGSLGSNDPRQFPMTPDPFTSKGNLGPLYGATHDGRYQWYMFVAVDNMGRHAVFSDDLLEGTVELPSMTINGVTYGRQRLPFKRFTYTELAPANC
jgi:hypothetical protein